MPLFHRKHLLFAIVPVLVTFIVSCSPTGKTSYNKLHPHLGENSPGDGQTKKRGTSDTGGGTGIDGKVFEGYQVNPYALKATLEVLAPIFEKFRPPAEEGEDTEGMYIPFVSGKVWYIAPLALDDVSKDSLGLSFIGAETDQLARQSLNEVWIDKEKFDAMSIEEQAELILHEMVMSEYMTRFKTWEEICLEFAFYGFSSTEVDADGVESNSPISCKSYSQNVIFQKAFQRAEEPRPLNEKDNEAIRKVTSWLLASKDRPDIKGSQALTHLLLDNGFDDRKLAFMSSNRQPPLKLADTQVINTLKKVVAGIFHFDKCYSAYDEEWRPCEFNMTFAGSQTGSSRFEIDLKDDNVTAHTNLFVFASEEKAEMSSVTTNLYSGLFFDLRFEAKVGDQFFTALVFFRKRDFATEADLDVDYIALIPGKVYHVEESSSGLAKCLTSKMEDPTNRQTAPLLIARKNIGDVIPRGVLMYLYSMPAALPCSFSTFEE